MASKEDICRKIEKIIPEAGKCGIDFKVDYDKANHCWAVDLHFPHDPSNYVHLIGVPKSNVLMIGDMQRRYSGSSID